MAHNNIYELVAVNNYLKRPSDLRLYMKDAQCLT